MNKDRIYFLLVLILAFPILVIQPCRSETLRILEQHSIDKYYGVKRALLVGEDTVMFLSTDGLYAQGGEEQKWQKLLDRAPLDEQVPFSVCDSERLNRLIYPSGLWAGNSAYGNNILIYEGFCNRLYRLRQASDGTSFLTMCDKRKGDDLFGETNVQEGTILSVLWGNDTKEKIVIQRINGGDYSRLFRCSESLVRWRDSVDLNHSALGIPAINSNNSTLWLSIDGYPYVYIIDMAGELRDSVPITNADFRRPARPISRIGSNAVTAHWFAQWTPIWFFSYVSPGYFIMQYNTGTDTCAGEKLHRYTTIVWNTNKQLVPLAVDPLWRLAGVQDDGRIIFVAPEADSSGCKETIVVTRIEP